MCPRIAHVVEDMKIGGQERVIQSILASMNRERYEPVLLCLTRGGAITDSVIKAGIETHILGIANYNSPASVIRVAGWFKKNRIAIAHTHAHPAGFLGRMGACLRRDIGIVHHVHTLSNDMQWRHHQKERILGLFTDRILCVSSSIRDFILEKERHAGNKVNVVYNGIKEPKIVGFDANVMCERLGIPSGAPVIGSVASLTENKGHASLLTAFSTVVGKYPDARLVLLGDGPLRSHLEGMAVQLGIQRNVLFLGNQEDVFPFIVLFDIFVLASIYREGLSISIIEAMSLGKPVVASGLPGNAEVVQDGRSGVLYPPGNSEVMAREMLTLLQNKGLREEMGAAGRNIYLEKFRVEQMIAKIEDVYDSILLTRQRSHTRNEWR